MRCDRKFNWIWFSLRFHSVTLWTGGEPINLFLSTIDVIGQAMLQFNTVERIAVCVCLCPITVHGINWFVSFRHENRRKNNNFSLLLSSVNGSSFSIFHRTRWKVQLRSCQNQTPPIDSLDKLIISVDVTRESYKWNWIVNLYRTGSALKRRKKNNKIRLTLMKVTRQSGVTRPAIHK